MMPPEHDVPDCACPWCRGDGANVTADEGAGVLSEAERESMTWLLELFGQGGLGGTEEEERNVLVVMDGLHRMSTHLAAVRAELAERERQVAAVRALRPFPIVVGHRYYKVIGYDELLAALDAPTAAQPDEIRCSCGHDEGDHSPNRTCRMCWTFAGPCSTAAQPEHQATRLQVESQPGGGGATPPTAPSHSAQPERERRRPPVILLRILAVLRDLTARGGCSDHDCDDCRSEWGRP